MSKIGGPNQPNNPFKKVGDFFVRLGNKIRSITQPKKTETLKRISANTAYDDLPKEGKTLADRTMSTEKKPEKTTAKKRHEQFKQKLNGILDRVKSAFKKLGKQIKASMNKTQKQDSSEPRILSVRERSPERMDWNVSLSDSIEIVSTVDKAIELEKAEALEAEAKEKALKAEEEALDNKPRRKAPKRSTKTEKVSKRISVPKKVFQDLKTDLKKLKKTAPPEMRRSTDDLLKSIEYGESAESPKEFMKAEEYFEKVRKMIEDF